MEEVTLRVCTCVRSVLRLLLKENRNFLALEKMLFFKWHTFLSISCLSFDGKNPCNCREGSRNINFNSFSLTKLCIKYTPLGLVCNGRKRELYSLKKLQKSHSLLKQFRVQWVQMNDQWIEHTRKTTDIKNQSNDTLQIYKCKHPY